MQSAPMIQAGAERGNQGKAHRVMGLRLRVPGNYAAPGAKSSPGSGACAPDR